PLLRRSPSAANSVNYADLVAGVSLLKISPPEGVDLVHLAGLAAGTGAVGDFQGPEVALADQDGQGGVQGLGAVEAAAHEALDVPPRDGDILSTGQPSHYPLGILQGRVGAHRREGGFGVGQEVLPHLYRSFKRAPRNFRIPLRRD